jgi:membrane protein insertase Oxa1/YidC/SpoIIIJ
VNPLKGVGYALAQAPLFILLFFALRDPTFSPQLLTEGLLWFKNLTLADEHFVLPLLNAASIFAAFEVRKFVLRKTEILLFRLELTCPLQKQTLRK